MHSVPWGLESREEVESTCLLGTEHIPLTSSFSRELGHVFFLQLLVNDTLFLLHLVGSSSLNHKRRFRLFFLSPSSVFTLQTFFYSIIFSALSLFIQPWPPFSRGKRGHILLLPTSSLQRCLFFCSWDSLNLKFRCHSCLLACLCL